MAIVTQTKKTTTPNCLAPSRDGGTFTCQWEIKSSNHNAGQWFQVRVNRIANNGSETWSDWSAINKDNNNITYMSKNGDAKIGKTTTKTVTFTLANAYSQFQFRVQGCREDEYHQIQKPSGNPHDQHYYVKSDGKWKITADTSVHKNKAYYKKINYTTSDYGVSPIYTFVKPEISVVGHELTSATSATFAWDTDISDTKAFYRTEYQTCLVEGWNSADGSGLPQWGSATRTNVFNPSGAYAIPETALDSTRSFTRWFRVHALGSKNNWGDESNWHYNYHTYAPPSKAVISSAQLIPNGSSFNVPVIWSTNNTFANPVDNQGVRVQYRVDTPSTSIVDGGSYISVVPSCPSSDSWTAHQSFNPESDNSNNTTITISDDLTDKAVFVRVQTVHDYDSNHTNSEPIFATGCPTPLTAPTISNVTAKSSKVYRVTITKNTAVQHAFTLIKYRTELHNEPVILGVIPYNGTYADVVIPDLEEGDSKPTFGVQAAIGTYSPKQATSQDKPTYYAFNDSTIYPMTSGISWDGGGVPIPPKITVVKKNSSTIQVSWTTPWEDATQVELSWANHEDAWESTDEPSTYLVGNTHAENWNISGLSIDTWYVRARLVKTVGESTFYGTYSDMSDPIALASAPETPSLFLNKTIAIPGDTITCSWAYLNPSDGSNQASAQLYEGTTELASTQTASSIQFVIPSTWEANSVHNLRIKVTSGYGISSDYSPTVPLRIAKAIDNIVVTTSLRNVDVIIDSTYSPVTSPSGNPHSKSYYEYDEETSSYILSEDTAVVSTKTYYSRSNITRSDLSLTKLPLTVSARGAGSDGKTTYIVERAIDYRVESPDETQIISHAGETIAIASIIGEQSVDIGDDINALYGTFNENALYKLYVIAEDRYGQTAESDPIYFYVHWEHTAQIPSALIEVDSDNLITYITPQMPASGYLEGDVCDIYRLSAEKPELIYRDALFGADIRYVDPYPTLGRFGGHRIVYRTKNGDHIAYVDGRATKAWTTYTAEDDDDIQDFFAIVIDFDGYQLRLPYNVTVSNSWTKDFVETKYLGGEVTGDWNPAVSKDVSLTTVIPIEVEPSKIELLNRLAMYSGACHVRTPDGASFAANVEVKDDREEKLVSRLSKVSLTIKRIQSDDFDGMTEAQWDILQPKLDVEYE